MKYCNICGSVLPDEAGFCNMCGAKQPEINVQLQEQQPYDQANMYGNSGNVWQAANEASAKTWQGTDLPASDEKKKGNVALIISLVILGISLITAIIATVILVKHKDDDSVVVRGNDQSTEAFGYKEDSGVDNTIDQVNDSTDLVDEVIDTSYDGLINRLNTLQRVTANYVSADVTDYPNVKVYFTINNDAGDSVLLTSPNVAIKEIVSGGEGIEREIKSFERLEGREGLSIELVADKSGSMESDLSDMQRIMSDFVYSLDYSIGDQVELIAFDSYVMYMCTFTRDTELLRNGIYNMTTYGETALYDALYEAVLNASRQEGARCVIAFTDGEDNSSIHTSEEVINLANSYSVPIFIIGTYYGSTSVYTDITNRTGGVYWDISAVTDMSDILETIYTNEKNMYCLEYVSDSAVDAYAERSVSCVFEDDTYGSSVDTSFTATEAVETEPHESRYELIVADISWKEANEECLRRGGHLITVTSQEEMDMAASMAESEGLRFIWMGGYTSVKNGSAYGHWITGETFDFQSWYPDEPSRTDKDGVDEMYLMLWQIEGVWSWNDQRNDPIGETGLEYFKGHTGYICEYED